MEILVLQYLYIDSFHLGAYALKMEAVYTNICNAGYATMTYAGYATMTGYVMK